jgi:hypothetical protein
MGMVSLKSIDFKTLGVVGGSVGVAIFEVILQTSFTAKIEIPTGNLPPDGNSLRNIGLAARILNQFFWLFLAIGGQFLTNPTFEQQPDNKIEK